MFVDHIKIYVKAGDGGNGATSFRREKYVPRGGPDGGDGGNGADVILQVDPHTDNLKEFFYQSRHKGADGAHGARHKKTGRSGKAKILKVPAGTVIYREVDLEPGSGAREEGDENEGLRERVADLTQEGERFVLASGGVGGKGNVHFKSATNQAPQESMPGTSGEEGVFFLELRRIADAGMVGFPNAGKSTLVSKLSAAKPKIAAYPFTTLRPMVGVLEFDGFCRATVADIPGLLEGAHKNVGLGHDFLRHIMRCRLLLFVVDMAGTEGREPIEDLAILRKEISLYDEDLAKHPWMIVANKMDLPEASEKLESFRSRFPKQEIVAISALEEEGIDALKLRLRELVGHRAD